MSEELLLEIQIFAQTHHRGNTMTQQVCRAMRLIWLMELVDERDWTVPSLAARLKVSEPTLRRDLLAIQGEPIHYPLVMEQVVRRMRRDSQEATENS